MYLIPSLFNGLVSVVMSDTESLSAVITALVIGSGGGGGGE
jgi:hypothetical protein